MGTVTETFEFNFRPDEEVDRATVVFQAIGAGSMCWEHLDRGGVFDSDRARAIGDAAMVELAKLDQPLLGLATTDQLLEELAARFRLDRVAAGEIGVPITAREKLVDDLMMSVYRAGIGGYRTVDAG